MRRSGLRFGLFRLWLRFGRFGRRWLGFGLFRLWLRFGRFGRRWLNFGLFRLWLRFGRFGRRWFNFGPGWCHRLTRLGADLLTTVYHRRRRRRLLLFLACLGRACRLGQLDRNHVRPIGRLCRRRTFRDDLRLRAAALGAHLAQPLDRLLYRQMLLARHRLKVDNRSVDLRQGRERGHHVDVANVDILVDRNVLNQRVLLDERARRPGCCP